MKKNKEGLPQKYLDLVGTKQTISGCVFSYVKNIGEKEYNVLDVRRGTAKIIDSDKMVVTNLTFELKLKNKSMKRAQWSRPFPDMITDISGIEI